MQIRLTRISQIDAELDSLKISNDSDFDLFLKSLTSSETAKDCPRITAKDDIEELKRSTLQKMKSILSKLDKEENIARKKLLVSIY